jgi:short-subunit dehydrogenase
MPAMVARDRGHVVLTGSLAAYRGLPGAIGYAASKAGLMALAESMRCDLRGTGVRVQVANPGFIRTRLTDRNDFRMPFLMEPEAAAARMFRFMGTDRFSLAFPFAFGLAFRAAALLPAGLHVRLFGGH